MNVGLGNYGNVDSDSERASPLQALCTLTPRQIRESTDDDIRATMIGVIAEMELHEVLEWSQRRSKPGVPLVNPHRQSPELVNFVERLANEIISHAAP